MPIQTKARWARLKVGLLAMIALAILGVLIFLLTGKTSFFAPKATLFMYVDDAAAVVEKAPVRLNGIDAGEVRKIVLSGLRERDKVIRMDLQIDAQYLSQIPVDSVAAIAAPNLLGNQYINIRKGLSPQAVHDGSTLNAKSSNDFNDIVEQGNSLLVQLQGILKRVDAVVGLVETGKGSIGKLLVDEELYNRIIGVVSEVQRLTAALNNTKGTLGKLVYDDALYTDFRGSIARINVLLEDLQAGRGSAGKFLKDPAMFDDIHKTVLDVRRLLADLEAGKGSAGKLLKSEELHNQVLSTIGKVDQMIDKLNSGQGTIGQLLVNQSMYDNLNGTTRELQEFVKDFRKDPKKFLHIKLSLF